MQKIGQSKKTSILEVICNTGSGFIIAWILTMYMLPLFDIKNINMSGGFTITTIYTVVSLIRSYLWRRYFNKLFIKENKC